MLADVFEKDHTFMELSSYSNDGFQINCFCNYQKHTDIFDKINVNF